MSVQMISCPKCGNPMPANAQYCPTCGHTNAFVAPSSAVPPSTPGPDAPESTFATPPPVQQYGQTQDLSPHAAQQYPQAPTPSYGQPPQYNYQYQQQVGVAGVPQRDPTVALLLELLGYIWFLGIGHIYGGRIARGVWLLIGYWLYWGIVAFLFLTLVLAPIGCVMAIIWPVVPILSGLWIKRDLERDNAMLRPLY
jgi:TM2 domain-containing membrane protein YozV